MRKSKELTKQMLQDNFKITNVTRDGRIFKGDKEVVQRENMVTHKYGKTQVYKFVLVPDWTEKFYKTLPSGATWWTYKVKRLLVHRIVYAWYNGIAHAGYEIDHIDNNTTNNNIENLQELSTQENRAKKTVSRNQYTYGLTDEEILAKRAEKTMYYNREKHCRERKPEWIKQKNERRAKKLDLRYTAALLKDIYKKQLVIVNKLKEQKKIDKEISVEKWRVSNMEYKKALKDALEIQNEWHKALQEYRNYKIIGE